MKRILTSLVLMVLLFPVLALGETMDDLVERDGLFYKEFTDVPFTGEITEQRIQGTVRNGKRDGIWVEYHSNGQLWRKETWKDGTRDGPWFLYHKNGQLWIKRIFKDGVKDGPFIRYYENGQLRSKGAYKGGEKEDDWVYYSSDGSVLEKGED